MSQLCNILIVESDPKTVEIVAPLLKKKECKVSYVKQGLNVVTHLSKNDFNLVLMNFKMIIFFFIMNICVL